MFGSFEHIEHFDLEKAPIIIAIYVQENTNEGDLFAILISSDPFRLALLM